MSTVSATEKALHGQAQDALAILKQTIFHYIKLHPAGVTSTDVVKALELYSDFEGRQKNYLSWSVIGLLVNEGKVRYENRGNRKYYFAS